MYIFYTKQNNRTTTVKSDNCILNYKCGMHDWVFICFTTGRDITLTTFRNNQAPALEHLMLSNI